MREIEVKAKIDDVDQIKAKLENLGCKFSKEIFQHDRIFTPEGYSYKKENLGIPVARIRNQDGKYIFTLKVPDKNSLDKIEHETEVGDAGEMEEAIKIMGYSLSMEIKKKRIKCKFKGDEICIDDVENLGSYIEMERLTMVKEAEIVQEELFEFFKSIGVRASDRVEVGYDVLLARAGYEKI